MTPFPQSHQWRILNFSWIAFCSTFLAWFAFAPLAPLIQEELGLSNAQIGWLAAAGVALTIPGRVIIGWLVDLLGPRKTYSLLLAVMALPVALLGFAQSFAQLLFLRLAVGMVGCGFVVGIRLVGDWFPKRQLGLAEGIYAGCGNAGSALAALSMPIIALTFGWRAALVLAAVPMLAWSWFFWRGVSDVPAGRIFRRTPRESSYSPWGDRRAWILALAYLASFGSEITIVFFLPKFFHEKFGLAMVGAGMFAAIFGVLNIFARPVGGWMADRWGGRRMIIIMLAGMSVSYLLLGMAPTFALAVGAMILSSLFVQASEGAVFAAVPLISATDTGRVAGMVGAAGNVGGLLFPLAFGFGLDLTGGSYMPGFLAVAAAGIAALAASAALRLTDEDAAHGHGFELGDSETPRARVSMTAGRPVSS